MREYPIEGMKMPTFVTNDVHSQMVIEVNYAPGDTYLIGYRSVGQKVGPRIPRTNAKTSSIASSSKRYDIDVSHDVQNHMSERYGYRPSPDDDTVYSGQQWSKAVPSGPQWTVHSDLPPARPGLFGRVASPSNNPRTSKKTDDPIQHFKTDQSVGHLGQNEQLDQTPVNEKSKNSLILGLLLTVAIVVVISGVSVVVYIKCKDEINSIRRCTEPRLEAKL